MSKKTKKSNKILVTGSAGFIGFHTCLELLALGNKVIGIDNINDYYDVKIKKERNKILEKQKNFKFVKCDFSNLKELNKKLGKTKFDHIIHLGAQAGVRYSIDNPHAFLSSNFLGTMNILEYAKENKVPHVVFASTSSVYGKSEKQPFEEHDKTDHPVSTYAATKKGTEVLAHTYSHLFGMKTTGLRFFTVYGPWGRPDMALFKFTKNILLGKPITVYNKGDMSRSFTYIDDVVSGIIGAMKVEKAHSIYNLGGDKAVQLMDFIDIIEKKIGKKAIKKFAPIQAGDMKATIASHLLSEKEIGYKAKTSVEEGVGKFVDWYLENQKWLLKLKDAKQ